MVAVCNSPSRMAACYSRTGDPAVGLASGPAGHGRVAGPGPPDRGAASIGAKDRIGAATSDGGAGAAPLVAWQVAQQLSGVRPGGQVGLSDHAGRTASHPSFHILRATPPNTILSNMINPRMWILMGQEEASISCWWEKVRTSVCTASSGQPDQAVASAAHSAPLLRLLTK